MNDHVPLRSEDAIIFVLSFASNMPFSGQKLTADFETPRLLENFKVWEIEMASMINVKVSVMQNK